jgi:hypothetical protein
MQRVLPEILAVFNGNLMRKYLILSISLTAGWSSGVGSRLRNQRSRVQILSRGFVMNNWTCSRVMAVFISYYQYT